MATRLPQPLLESEDTQGEDHDSKSRQDQKLRPKIGDADPLEENAPQDLEVIGQGHEMGQGLANGWHPLDREEQAREVDPGEEEEVRDSLYSY